MGFRRATPPHKQQIKARETLSIYAPLANRLGMWKVKNELQQISLEILDEPRYTHLLRQIEERNFSHQQTYIRSSPADHSLRNPANFHKNVRLHSQARQNTSDNHVEQRCINRPAPFQPVCVGVADRLLPNLHGVRTLEE